MKVACSIDDIDPDLLYGEIMIKLANEDEEKKILANSVSKIRETMNVNREILKEI
jgi:hypothetical protein